jgi:hypothetical protein
MNLVPVERIEKAISMFQLATHEADALRSQNATLRKAVANTENISRTPSPSKTLKPRNSIKPQRT